MARDDETERYRKAANLALDQLDWCVEYFRRIRKSTISNQIAENRSAIAQRLVQQERHRAREPDAKL
jgi:hypothetical protein